MQINFLSSIAEIDREAWNRLQRDNNPFMRHEFLYAAEQNQCVGERFGWVPRHLAILEDGQLIAAMPLYEKSNSYGEFVFDHSWADAYQRNGLSYFPKLVTSIPYTPATGTRILCEPGQEQRVYPLVRQTMQQVLQQAGISGWHLLFADSAEIDYFHQQSFFIRHDCQYHWFNDGYDTFDQFLDQLSSRKRKNIRKERERVNAEQIRFRWLNGHTATASDWQHFTTFYNRTFEEKWGMATFNLGFFSQIGKTMPDNVLLVLADHEDRTIAGALMYVSDTHLYGRHWGCIEQFDNLHFETCYYQGIEYCIQNNIRVFEPGAQGEHKVARGFRPVQTRSAHWLTDNRFHPAISNFCQHEQAGVDAYIEQLESRLPFKKD